MGANNHTRSDLGAEAQSEGKIPVYLVINRSASMRGEPIAAVNNGVATILGSLRQDKYLLEKVILNIICFDSVSEIILEDAEIKDITNPEFIAADSYAENINLAFDLIHKNINGLKDKMKSKFFLKWAPHILVVTHGDIELDGIYECIDKLRKQTSVQIIGCFTSFRSTSSDFAKVFDHEVKLDTIDGYSVTNLLSFIEVRYEFSSINLSSDEAFFDDKHIDYFRKKLEIWKHDIVSGRKDASVTLTTARLPNLVDRASLDFDWDIKLRARERQGKLLGRIEAALRRIEDGEFGYCEVTGEPISLKRLEAWPLATMTLEAQEDRERKMKMYRSE